MSSRLKIMVSSVYDVKWEMTMNAHLQGASRGHKPLFSYNCVLKWSWTN
jgi:hypothetical protein